MMHECPEFIELEEDLAGFGPVVARINRETVEKFLGRNLVDRHDFLCWREAHYNLIMEIAYEKSLMRPFFLPGEIHAMIIEEDDLALAWGIDRPSPQPRSDDR